MRHEGDNGVLAFVLSLALHVVIVLLAWLSSLWVWSEPEKAQGEPIGATLELSTADVQRAEKAIAQARKANPEPPADAPPQPTPEPAPQTADTPPQPKPQEQLDKPDTVDQEQVVRNAIDPSDALAEQQARQRQEQVELTEDIAKQQEVERRQRLREQYEAVRREREEATRRTRMEEMRLAQLADRPKPATPRPGPATPAAAGEVGDDTRLRARYIAALNATARENWNTALAPPTVQCDVRFTQIPGGEVINIEFITCPYDAQVRESVERALRKTPMPFSGFENVFEPKVNLTFCYPEEACQ